jgi:hypothetical protein
MKVSFHGSNFIYTLEKESVEYLFRLESDNVTMCTGSRSAYKKLCLVDKEGDTCVMEFRDYGIYAIKYKEESLIACFNKIRG